MDKMEHMDPQRCDRIWQRVSPELDPYPEVRAACREPSREPGAENIPERTGAAAVPAAPEIPAEPAESGCCLAGRAMGSIRLIQDFIEDELADRRAYLAYAACAPNVAARRLLRGCSASSPPSGPAPQAAPVDQRSSRDRVGMVEPPARLLPAMGGEGRHGADAGLKSLAGPP